MILAVRLIEVIKRRAHPLNEATMTACQLGERRIGRDARHYSGSLRRRKLPVEPGKKQFFVSQFDLGTH